MLIFTSCRKVQCCVDGWKGPGHIQKNRQIARGVAWKNSYMGGEGNVPHDHSSPMCFDLVKGEVGYVNILGVEVGFIDTKEGEKEWWEVALMGHGLSQEDEFREELFGDVAKRMIVPRKAFYIPCQNSKISKVIYFSIKQSSN